MTVALLDRVEPAIAPWARNRSERLLFHQLYETLIRIDCAGNVFPALAESWRSSDGGRHWRFELGSGVRFWDGAPLTATDVKRSWMQFALDRTAVSSVLDSVVAEGNRIVHVFLSRAHTGVPRELSSLEFAVMKEPADSPWPVGSGPYEIVEMEQLAPAAGNRRFLLRSIDGAAPRVLRFLESPAADARDVIRDGIDMMVTSDHAVLEYIGGRQNLAAVPLAWEWTYVMVVPSRAEAESRLERAPRLSSGLLDEIARDAVRVDARGYRGPAWWDGHGEEGERNAAPIDSPPRPGRPRAAAVAPRIVYDRGDATARALAERIVALVAGEGTGSLQSREFAAAIPALGALSTAVVAEGVAAPELESCLRSGTELACIIKLPRRPVDPYRASRRLFGVAPWTGGGTDGFIATLVPLIDVRAHLVIRPGRFGAAVDWYGDISIVSGRFPGGEPE